MLRAFPTLPTAAMTDRPLLSICVPTYNRAGFLRECLASIEADGAQGRFEVVVSDNASTDDTLSVLQEFSAVLPLRWIVQRENLGPDRNFDAVVEFARGEYCLLLGSDDVMEPGAVPRLIHELDSTGTDIYHFGYVQGDIGLKRLHRAHPPAGRVATTPERLARYLGGMPNMSLVFTFISSYAFRRSLWMERRERVRTWIGSYYIQLFAMHAALKAGATLTATSDCLVLARGDNPNDFNSVPARFVALDARTMARLIDEVYGGDRRLWEALGRTFHRSYPVKRLVYLAASGGLPYISESRASLINLGYSRWLLDSLAILGRLGLLKLCKSALDLRRGTLRKFSPKSQ